MSNKDPMLMGYLEPIILSEKDFEILKKATSKLLEGRISAKDFKKLILSLRVQVYMKVLEMIPFYQENIVKNQAINKHARGAESGLETELAEKTELLQQVGERVNNILQKLLEGD